MIQSPPRGPGLTTENLNGALLAESQGRGNSTAYAPMAATTLAGVNVNYYKMFPSRRDVEDEGTETSSQTGRVTFTQTNNRDLGALVQQQQEAWRMAEQDLFDLRKSSAAQAAQQSARIKRLEAELKNAEENRRFLNYFFPGGRLLF